MSEKFSKKCLKKENWVAGPCPESGSTMGG